MGCSIVNIGGDDIHGGNRKLVLGLSWQLMRMNIFQILGAVPLTTKLHCLCTALCTAAQNTALPCTALHQQSVIGSTRSSESE